MSPDRNYSLAERQVAFIVRKRDAAHDLVDPLVGALRRTRVLLNRADALLDPRHNPQNAFIAGVVGTGIILGVYEMLGEKVTSRAFKLGRRK